MQKIKFNAEIWLYSGEKASWHFVTVPQEQAKQIKFYAGESKRGWGSVPVRVTIGESQWNTSVFPDKKEGTYLLPLKAAIRTAEKLAVGQMTQVIIEVNV